MQSATIGALAEALAKAQGKIRTAAKDKRNPHFKSEYADLASVWAACREALSTNGLAVVQRNHDSPDRVVLETVLIHSSGEWITGVLSLPCPQQTAQGYGSAITYARRYGLAAIVGVAPSDEDDDGVESSSNPRVDAGDQNSQAVLNRALAAISAATTREELNGLVPRIQKLTPDQQNQLSAPFREKMEKL